MQGRHLVTIRYVIRKTGDKHDLHGFIVLPDLLCKGNSVHRAHFNIQEKNIPILIFGIPEQEALCRREHFRPDAGLPLIRPVIQNTFYKFCIRCAVIHDCNPIGHVFTFFRYFAIL